MNFALKPDANIIGTSYCGKLAIDVTRMQQVFGNPQWWGEDSEKGYSGIQWRFISDDGQVVTVYERWQELHVGASSNVLFEPFVAWLKGIMPKPQSADAHRERSSLHGEEIGGVTTKMNMIWIATAKLIYPRTSPSRLISQRIIEQEVHRLFDVKTTPVMLEKHLVSWEDRQADTTNPKRGGSRNRYLFRTIDGLSPSENGDFRLYKNIDAKYDGKDKTGRTHPEFDSIPPKYHYLVEWYETEYRVSLL